MRLSEESIWFNYAGALCRFDQGWDARAEVQSRHLLDPDRVEAFREAAMQVRSQVAAERDLREPPAKISPLEAGFIDLPRKLLEDHRRHGEESELGRILWRAGRLREEVGRVIVLGVGGSFLAAKALFGALSHSFHNELPERARLGQPRLYFEGNGLDSDPLQELLELLEHECVDPELPGERWGLVVISKSGSTLETAAAYRLFRSEAARFYGSAPEKWRPFVVPITGPSGKLRSLCLADGFAESDILTIPQDVGGRYSAFTAAGLFPAALVGLDVRALLLGASQMTTRFIEEPFERNPVLQYAAINHLAHVEMDKPVRALAVWSKKLEALGLWHDQLVAGSLGKRGTGPTPVSVVQTRDLHTRGQQHQEGRRDTMINNLIVRSPHNPGLPVGMADRDEDDLNALSRKTYPDLLEAALDGTNQAYRDAGRPTAEINLPMITEHTIGQLMQMLMLATVVEARLLGVNPHGQPGVENYKRNVIRNLRES